MTSTYTFCRYWHLILIVNLLYAVADEDFFRSASGTCTRETEYINAKDVSRAWVFLYFIEYYSQVRMNGFIKRRGERCFTTLLGLTGGRRNCICARLFGPHPSLYNYNENWRNNISYWKIVLHLKLNEYSIYSIISL